MVSRGVLTPTDDFNPDIGFQLNEVTLLKGEAKATVERATVRWQPYSSGREGGSRQPCSRRASATSTRTCAVEADALRAASHAQPVAQDVARFMELAA